MNRNDNVRLQYEKQMIKKWKINEKHEKLEPRKDRWVEIPKMQKTSSFFHLFFIFLIFF